MLMICVCVCVCEMMIINIYCLHSVVYDDSSGFVCIFWIFSHTKEIGLLHLNGRLFYFFYFFVTYTHECTWAFLLFVLTASTWRISWFFTCWPELCVTMYRLGLWGVLRLELWFIYLFAIRGFRVVLMFSANFRRFWVNFFKTSHMIYLIQNPTVGDRLQHSDWNECPVWRFLRECQLCSSKK